MPQPARDVDDPGAETPARGAYSSGAEASTGGAHDPGAETPAQAAPDPRAETPPHPPHDPGAETPPHPPHDPGAETPARDEGRRPARAHTAVTSGRTRPTAPGPRAADVLAQTIRAAILSGELAPGAPLREEELSTAHGVSRHTARTALAHLTAEHLATAEPYRGVRVSLLDDDALVALQQLRCALETEALRIVRDRGIRPPDVDAALDDLAAADAAADWPATLAAHARVHLALVEAAGSPRIAAEYRRLDSEMHLLLTHVRPAYAPGSLTAEHRAYVEQALADPERAVRAHLDHSTRAIIDGRRRS